MPINLLCVAVGGGLGAVCRYLCGLIPVAECGGFPIMTLLINFVGALLIGIIAEIADSAANAYFNISDKVILLLKVGFCGGFTTFSTFSLEMFNLVDRGKVWLALAYALVSVVICFAGVLLGRYLIKTIFAK